MSSLSEWLIAEYPLELRIKDYINEIYSWCELHYTECNDLMNDHRLATRNIIIIFSELVEIDSDIYIILLCGLYENKEDLIKIFNITSNSIKCKIIDAIDLITNERYTPSVGKLKEFYKIRGINKPDKMINELKNLRSILIENNNKKFS